MPRVANFDDIIHITAAKFDDIIHIATMFIKTILKDSKKHERIRKYLLKFNLYLHFLIYQKLLISCEKW